MLGPPWGYIFITIMNTKLVFIIYRVCFESDTLYGSNEFHNEVNLLNRSLTTGQGALYSMEVPVIFKNTTKFVNNSRSALVLDGSTLEVLDQLQFINNTGFRGGAIAMYGRSRIIFRENANLTLEANSCDDKGGAMYIQAPGLPLESYNATDTNMPYTCFFGYFNSSVDYNKWNTTVIFKDNKSPHNASGRPVYATTLKSCWKARENRDHNSVLRWKFVKFRNLPESFANFSGEVATDPVDIKHKQSDWEVASADDCFTKPVGISDQAQIPDNHLTASSQYDDRFQPAYGRLNGDRGDGWCAKESARNDDWLQVDLGKTFQVCALATQGDRNGNEWVTDFMLSYSSDGNVWNTYKDENGVDVEFHRQGDSNTVDQHKLPVPVSARYFRFHPTKQHSWNCLRVELYGADDCFTKPVGVSDQAQIPDNRMTASSQYADGYQPAYGRLNGDRGDGWCAKESARNDDWLQVDLGTTFLVCAVATQGDRNGNEWVTDFMLSYSSDGNVWNTYKDENGVEVEFHRQGDSNTVDQHKLPVPVYARYFRFHPTKQHTWNCLRVELYGVTHSCPKGYVGSPCQDIESPTMSCPFPALYAAASPGKATATVEWSVQVNDNSVDVDSNAVIQVQSSHQSGQEFFIGITVVKITATDEAGNVATCSFSIEVKDTEPPICSSCPADKVLEVTVTTLEMKITWDRPVCSDNSGVPPIIESNYQSGELFSVPSSTLVLYSVRDSSNNVYYDCSFRITLEVKSCPSFSPPQNGALACTNWDKNRYPVCAVLCKSGTDFEFNPPLLYYCEQGEWKFYALPGQPYEQKTPGPNCSGSANTSWIKLAGFVHYYYSGDAHDPSDQEDIKSQFHSLLSSPFVPPYFCASNPADCTKESISVSPGVIG